MALGWDTYFARAALSVGVPLVAACPGVAGQQSSRWAPTDRAEYERLLAMAVRVVQVGEFIPYGKACNIRNEWMVDRAQLILAAFNGRSGGTANCVNYAKRRQITVLNLWPVVN